MLQVFIRKQVDADHEMVKVFGEDRWVIEHITHRYPSQGEYLKNERGNYIIVDSIEQAKAAISRAGIKDT